MQQRWNIQNGFRNALAAIHQSILHSLQYSEHQIQAVGLVGFIGFPLFYFIWTTWYPQPYENFYLRMLGSVLCFFLMIKESWPARCRRYLPLYWYITILYSLSFFFSYMIFKSHFSIVSVMSMLTAMFLMVLLVDWVGLLVLSVLGFLVAWILYFVTEQTAVIPGFDAQYLIIYAFTLIAGSVFNYKTALLQQEKLQGMSAASGSIAHELRTPLLGIKSGAAGLKRYLPILFDAYRQASEQKLPVGKIRAAHFQALEPILERIEAETHYANTIIDMLLMNVGRQSINSEVFTHLSMTECVNIALARYPFEAQTDREKILWQGGPDFFFKGSQLLMVHVLFNLIKNALYFIARAEKGQLTLWLVSHPLQNELHIRDTGQGIPPEVLPKLFHRFFTTTNVGTGIGLSFCRMVIESFSGQINCKSEYGNYTEFTLSFPQIAC